MSIVGGLLEKRYAVTSVDASNVPLTAANILAAWAGVPTASGKRIDEETALRISTVYACVRVLAESIAGLPLIVYRRAQPRGKERAPEHQLYTLLHDQPNPWMSAFSFFETLVGHQLLWGNAFAEIVRDAGGGVTSLVPLRPDRMDRPTISASGDLLYTYHKTDSTKITLPKARVLHVPALSSDGIWGYGPITLQRESLGLAATAEEFEARFFSNDASPAGILSVKGNIKPESAERLKADWERMHGGLENARRTAVLEEGVTFVPLTMPLQDAQFLELRKHQRSEIAGWFRVPPHLIGDLERATFSNIEHQSINFVVHSLRPWLVRWEQEIRRSLFTEAERRLYFAEFLIDGLLRGDAASRATYYSQQFSSGGLTPNEQRELENRNPVPGGDELFVPLNLVPLSMAEAVHEPKSEPAPQAPTEELAQEQDALREERSLRGRLRLRETFRPLLKHVASELVRRESDAIRNEGLPLLNQRSAADFLPWLMAYHSETLAPLAVTLMQPVLSAYAGAVERDVLEELKRGPLLADVEDYVELVAGGFSETYSNKSFGQLRKLLRDAAAAGTDPAQAVTERLSEWQDSRANKVADGEKVRSGEAFARRTYERAGVTRFRWRASGKNCPACSGLNGKVVGVQQDFAAKGESLSMGEGKPAIRPSHPVRHAPLHGACDCAVVPERA